MESPNRPQLRPLRTGRRSAHGENNTLFPIHPSVGSDPVGIGPSGVSLYVSAPGIEPLRIRTVRHRLHRPMGHVMLRVDVPEIVFTYCDFLHLTPALRVVDPLPVDLTAHLEPALSPAESLRA